MKKLSLAFCTAALFAAYPVLAQSRPAEEGHGQGHGHKGHGNNSNHSGHDDDGNSAGHRKDRPHGFGDDDNLVLTNPTDAAAVAATMTSVTTALKSGSLLSASGAEVPQAAQARTYAVLSSGPTQSASTAEMLTALSTAGSAATAIAPALVRGFSGLSSNPGQLPAVIAKYNDFTNAASNSFIANPPPEFIAIHAVLKQLTSASTGTR